MSFALSGRWGRAAAGATLALTLASSAPARASNEEPPPPGTQRLIEIGPQALVREDEHGNVTMVDEPAPEQTPGDIARGVIGVMGLGAIFLIQGASQQTFGGTSAVRR